MSLARTVQPNMKRFEASRGVWRPPLLVRVGLGPSLKQHPKRARKQAQTTCLPTWNSAHANQPPLAVPYHPQQLTDNTIGLDKLRPGPKPRPGLIGKRSKLGRRPRRGLWLIQGSAPRPCIGAAPCWFGVGSRLAQQPLGKLLGNGFEATWPSTWAFYFCLIR